MIHLTWVQEPNLGKAEGSINHSCFPLFPSCVPLLSLNAVGPHPEPLRDRECLWDGTSLFYTQGTGSGQSYVLTGIPVKLLGQDFLQVSLTVDTMPMTPAQSSAQVSGTAVTCQALLL